MVKFVRNNQKNINNSIYNILYYSFYLFLLFFYYDVSFSQNTLTVIPSSSFKIVDGITKLKVDILIDEFLISKTEVTQKEFFDIMNYNPSYHKGDEYPVENVSWWEAIRYCNLKSIKDGFQPCYDLATGECDLSCDGYRLPTDAEWSRADSNMTEYDDSTIHKYANVGSADTKNIPLLLKSLRENGTAEAGIYPPNSFGLYDMLGNVWEWCNDYYNPADNNFFPLKNPQGPSWGTERVIRGSSFISTASEWNKSYRSSMKPEYKSRFTGFRICRRSQQIKTEDVITGTQEWFKKFNDVPKRFENSIGKLSDLLLDKNNNTIESVSRWKEKRKILKARWEKLLGTLSVSSPEPEVKLIKIFNEEIYTGKLMYLQVEPDFWEKIYLMIPDKPITKPAPVVITPYYDVDTPAGKNMGGRTYAPPGVRSFAYSAVQQGYIAIAVRWFGESYGENYVEAVSNFKLRYPECTGLGKWVWDVQRVVDYLYTLPEVDREKIAIIGHSLGGKMALYASAMDERIKVTVASELGIGFPFSNYDDFWYFGDFIKDIDKSIDQHELLGLIAPRPFLLIGGDKYDTDNSWNYINSAKKIYTLFGKPEDIGYFNHRSGHSPAPEAVQLSVEWLKYFLK